MNFSAPAGPECGYIQTCPIASSANSVFLIKDNGEIYATGLNDKGQLGVGDNKNKNLPTLVGFGEDARVTQISASGDHTLAR